MLNLFLVTVLFTLPIYTIALESEDVPALENEFAVEDEPALEDEPAFGDEPTGLDLSKYARIFGGQKADIESYPYQASLVQKDANFCGAFIVSREYILTVAHCVNNTDPSELVLRAGSSLSDKGTIIPIAEIIPHPKYNSPLYDKDVAVLKTVEAIVFTKQIQPIPLPSKGRAIKTRTYVTVSGWGQTQERVLRKSHELMGVQIPVMNYTACLRYYREYLTNNMFCGGKVQGDKNTSGGDSGGPAVQDGMAVGVVAFGVGEAGYPSVFVDIASPTIRDFIKNHTEL